MFLFLSHLVKVLRNFLRIILYFYRFHGKSAEYRHHRVINNIVYALMLINCNKLF